MIFADQPQREALINLMLAVRFSDRVLSLSEQDTFENIVKQMAWQDVVSSESLINQAMGRVRDAFASEETLDAFLKSQSAIFTTAEEKSVALKKLMSVAQVDGLHEKEAEIIDKIKQLIQVS